MKPILFNTEMVRAILDNRKTVTRRVVNPQPAKWQRAERLEGGNKFIFSSACEAKEYNPPYHPGDILYVRETWNYGYLDMTDFELKNNEAFFEELKPGSMKDSFLFPRYFYRTEDLDGIVGMKWRPSIHMPRVAARIFLRVTNVWVERLQKITAEQCVSEGLGREPLDEVGTDFMRGMFSDLWDSTINPADRALYGWEANPWVWVIEFERISREAAE